MAARTVTVTVTVTPTAPAPRRQRPAGLTLAILALASFGALAGCATAEQAPRAPQVPPEPPLTLQLPGTSTEVQAFLEERFRTYGGGAYRIDSATDRAISFKIDCARIPDMSAFRCAAIMMGVGNSGWSGPWGVTTFRTTQVRDVVHFSGEVQWCATNALGRTNCMPAASSAEMNKVLREIEQGYLKQRAG